MTPEPNSPLARLYAAPYTFDFFQAVRLLAAAAAGESVGTDAAPAEEPVRFSVLNSTAFPPSAVVGLTAPTAGPPRMTVAFFGLTGPVGVMPRAYTEQIARLVGDTKAPEPFAMRDWFDVFNHRLLSLFYRAWAKYRFYLPHDGGEPAADGPEPFTAAVRSLVGLGTAGLAARGGIAVNGLALAAVPDATVLFYAGHFAHRPRTAAGLEALLAEYVGLPVRVVPFRGQWLPVPKASRAGVGAAAVAPLGSGPVLGRRAWDVQSKFRVRIGPATAAQFGDLLPDPAPVPGGKRYYQLLHLIRLYAGPEFDVEVQVVLRAEAVPACRLPAGTARGPRLGRDAWLRTLIPAADAPDAVFTPDRPAEVHP